MLIPGSRVRYLAEIAEQGVAPAVPENVVAVEIAMQDAARMQPRDR